VRFWAAVQEKEQTQRKPRSGCGSAFTPVIHYDKPAMEKGTCPRADLSVRIVAVKGVGKEPRRAELPTGIAGT